MKPSESASQNASPLRGSPLMGSPNSGHMVSAYALTQMLGFASHFVCPQNVIRHCSSLKKEVI